MKHSDFRCPQVALFALKDIEPNEELCYDYGDIFWSFKGTKSLCHCKRLYLFQASPLPLKTISDPNKPSFGLFSWSIKKVILELD